MKVPRSWSEAEVCTCQFCRDLVAIRDRCLELDGFLYVHDLRKFDQGFSVGDVRKLFVEAAVIAVEFETVDAAAQYVLERQSHCDALVSSWPLKPAGRLDFLWEREVVA